MCKVRFSAAAYGLWMLIEMPKQEAPVYPPGQLTMAVIERQKVISVHMTTWVVARGTCPSNSVGGSFV